MSALPRGLYAITPDESDTDKLVAQCEAALRGGAVVLQYRNKTAPAALKRRQALALLLLCRRLDTPLIINDDVHLAMEIDADGVHLGGKDGDPAAARAKLGPDKLLGVSCYNELTRAHAASDAGADHVAFGAVYPTQTKPNAPRASFALFTQAKGEIGLPIVGIGGITLGNALPVIAAGAHAVAVISDVFSAPDIESRARDFAKLFNGQ